MKTIFKLLIAFGFSGCTGNVVLAQTIPYPGYTSFYNATTKIPDSVIWIAKPHVKAVGREAGFHTTGNRPNLSKDYAHSGYDIGHNCDASDENGNKTDEYNSFDFANTFPQRPNNNRITWLALESQTRVWAKQYGQVRVKVSWKGSLGKLGRDAITIPAYTIKEVWFNHTYEKFVMPNSDTINRHVYIYYRTK